MSIGLISAKKLVEMMSSQPVQLVDARRAHEYAAGHIPGAISLCWEDWCEKPPANASESLQEPGYWGRLADPVKGKVAQRLSQMGIGSGKPIVVYANNVASKGREGRVAWMLLYLGAGEVLLLDGGAKGWVEQGGLWERDVHHPDRATFTLKLDNGRRALFADLKKAHEKNDLPLLIDTRSQKEFQGDCYEYQPRKGRMPNSVLLPFNILFGEDGRFQSADRFVELLPKEVKDKGRKVSYCEVGVRAATFALLHEIYTGEIIPVYDGSIMEWGLDPSLPVL